MPVTHLTVLLVATVAWCTSCTDAGARRVTAPPSSTPPATATATTTTTTTIPPTAPAGALGRLRLNLVDHSRPTVSRGRLVSSSRALTTTVWFPAGPAVPHPLVVFAHGFRVGVAPYVRACEAWARRGFVVAAPAFPLTDQAVAGAALDEADMVNQPADVSFVISQVTSLADRVDPRNVAVVGHSDGADTALDVGFLPSRRDPRIRAVIADAPDPLPLPAHGPRLAGLVPLLLVHGDRDAIAPFSGSQQVARQLATPGWFLVLKGADHLSPIEGPSVWTATFDRVTGDFLENVFAGLPSPGARLAADVIGSPASIGALG